MKKILKFKNKIAKDIVEDYYAIAGFSPLQESTQVFTQSVWQCTLNRLCDFKFQLSPQVFFTKLYLLFVDPVQEVWLEQGQLYLP